MSQSLFTTHTIETAPPECRQYFEGAQKRFGFLPDPMAKLANAPVLLDTFMKMNAIFDKETSLTPVQREVIVMTISAYNGCGYCMALHTSMLKGMSAPEDVIQALRTEQPLQDAGLKVLAEFTRSVLETRGQPPESAIKSLFEAGFTQRQALEVVLGIGVYTLTTYANRLTRVELDPPLEAFRWMRER